MIQNPPQQHINQCASELIHELRLSNGNTSEITVDMTSVMDMVSDKQRYDIGYLKKPWEGGMTRLQRRSGS